MKKTPIPVLWLLWCLFLPVALSAAANGSTVDETGGRPALAAGNDREDPQVMPEAARRGDTKTVDAAIGEGAPLEGPAVGVEGRRQLWETRHCIGSIFRDCPKCPRMWIWKDLLNEGGRIAVSSKITWGQYAACVAAGECPKHAAAGKSAPGFDLPDFDLPGLGLGVIPSHSPDDVAALTFAQAHSVAVWLSRISGRTYRPMDFREYEARVPRVTVSKFRPTSPRRMPMPHWNPMDGKRTRLSLDPSLTGPMLIKSVQPLPSHSVQPLSFEDGQGFRKTLPSNFPSYHTPGWWKTMPSYGAPGPCNAPTTPPFSTPRACTPDALYLKSLVRKLTGFRLIVELVPPDDSR